MNEKEIAEVRRRYSLNKNNISHIRGCYVNEKGEIVSAFDQSLHIMPEAESENILGVLKRTLSGTLGKNLLDIEFDTKQVVDSDEHRLLMALKNSELKDEEAVQAFFKCVIQNLVIEGNYLILLTHDTYDVPYHSTDGESQADASSEVYSYILCSICPIKTRKPAISYYITQNEFHNCKSDWLVGAPELGFLFPAFDDRSSNIYNALYYSRDLKEIHREFVDSVFHTQLPMPAAVQKETFESILADTLDEDCSYEVVKGVHGQLCEMIEEHKINKEVEPLVISKSIVKNLLQSSGVSAAKVIAFDEKYDMEFGAEADLSPRNIVNDKQFELCTPDVTIHVNPKRSDLIKTQIIDGTRYIMIRADEDVEVNGINISIRK